MNRSNIKSIAALVLTGAASALVVGFRTTDAPAASTTTTAAGSTGTGGSGSSSSTGSSGSARPGAGPSGAGATLADGTWTGAPVREPWGTFEVQAVISGGKISNVTLVASPSDRRSSSINRQAVPLLTESAIAEQSANIDLISGATWTSESYGQSLQAALDAAKAAAQKAA